MPDGSRIERAQSGALLTLPNVISFARLCAVPLAFWLVIGGRFGAAFVLFVGAGASDAVDGWLARRNGGGNGVGAVLDAVADKALLVTMYVTLAAAGEIPDWLAILVVFRDLIIVGGVLALALLGQPVTIRPLFVSKVNTVLQIVLVALTLFVAGSGVVAPAADAARVALSWAVATSTLASGAAYVWRSVWLR
jgi:cardiolipin synthase